MSQRNASQTSSIGTSHAAILSEAESGNGDSVWISLLAGCGLTILFYLGIHVLPFGNGFLLRYFCSHPLEYASTGLFIVGMTILGRKALRLRTEYGSLRSDWSRATSASDQTPIEMTNRLTQQLQRVPAPHRRSLLNQRIADVIRYLRGRRSGEGLEEHLKYLAEFAAERLHESYSPVRTVTWAVPILGFLGTVIGITMAIANVTPDQLDTSLAEVTGGLAIAFDTTALALTLSVFLVFGSFLVERSEQNILAEIERFGIGHLLAEFPAADGKSTSAGKALAEAEQQAAQLLIERTEQLIEEQTQTWQQGMKLLRENWQNTIATQMDDLQHTMQSGLSATLTDHAEHLQQTREELVNAFRSGTEAHTRSLAEMTHQASARVDRWHDALKESSLHAAEQMEQLHRQCLLLQELTEGEHRLSQLQERLNQNIEAVRGTEMFEDTLHNLTAAVNLLTARSRTRAA